MRRRRFGVVAALVVMAAAAVARADAPGTAVRVERVRPARPKLATLQFLKENRDWIRARFDLLRARAIASTGAADPIDPRFLDYARMLREVEAAADSAAAMRDARERRELLASIGDLAGVESELDRIETALAVQRGRLGVLEEDFTGDQRTALVVVLAGAPASGAPSELAVTLDDGEKVTIPLPRETLATLAAGGVVQVLHRLVEPREQVLEVRLAGGGWPADDHAFVTIDPARDRLTFLRFDLSALRPATGAGALAASTWLHDTSGHPGGR